MEIINPALPVALTQLGYSDSEVEAIVDYVMAKDDSNGYSMIKDGKIEGAPFLKEKHYKIFDTANRCGTGHRFIAPEGHVKMMAALAPNVSGSISKTVNLPHDATVEEIKNIYYMSWKLGVKSIALYRDGCKASQPLNTAIYDDETRHLDDYSFNELLEYAKSLHGFFCFKCFLSFHMLNSSEQKWLTPR